MKEIVVGLLNGVAIGLVVGGVSWLWKNDIILGVITFAAMVLNMVAAGIAGVVIPFGLKALRIDPALASAIMLTTVTDVIGFDVGDLLLRKGPAVPPIRHEELCVGPIGNGAVLDEPVDVCCKGGRGFTRESGVDGVEWRHGSVVGAGIFHLVGAPGAMAGLTPFLEKGLARFPSSHERGGFGGRSLFAGRGDLGSICEGRHLGSNGIPGAV